VPLRDRLRAATHQKVFVENDANAAAYGEFVAGAGRAARDMVMLTLGTGVGGGVILEGRLLRGHFDNAGEIGHMIVEPGGDRCPCGQRGCLERYASASAVGRWAGRELEAGAASSLREMFERTGQVDARDVQLAMAAGDALAARLWNETVRYLAIAAVNIQHMLNPEQIILAGGLIGAGDRLLDPLREQFARLTWNSAADGPSFALATLGTDAGVIGVAALAREAGEGDVA
jgi:glucokinase